MQSNLSETIDITADKARYDTSVKELLADKQILARILKYATDEFAEDDIPDIILNIGEPQIGSVRMEPGHTNTETEEEVTERIAKEAEEDSVLDEGKIFYDIRFSAYRNQRQLKYLINVEAQKSTNPKKLGYELDNRILYYLGRMVSSQKEVEFRHSFYDDLKAVRSIWICMDAGEHEDAIHRIRYRAETAFGETGKYPNIDKVQAVVLRLRSEKTAEKSDNVLIAMLEELLKNDDAEKKKNNLSRQYGLVMNTDTERRIHTMCNLSDLMIEKGIEQGIEQGFEKGIEQGLEKGIEQGLEKGIEQGERKKAYAIASKLHTMGMDTNFIAQALNATIDEVQQLLTGMA